jgi:hypothetical protein
MKQSAAKTLGVAALGAAFAAAGAGVASAAPGPAPPDTGQALDKASQALAAQDASQAQPGEGAVVGKEQRTAGADRAPEQPATAPLTKPVNKLLGGLPVNGPSTDSLKVGGSSLL